MVVNYSNHLVATNMWHLCAVMQSWKNTISLYLSTGPGGVLINGESHVYSKWQDIDFDVFMRTKISKNNKATSAPKNTKSWWQWTTCAGSCELQQKNKIVIDQLSRAKHGSQSLILNQAPYRMRSDEVESTCVSLSQDVYHPSHGCVCWLVSSPSSLGYHNGKIAIRKGIMIDSGFARVYGNYKMIGTRNMTSLDGIEIRKTRFQNIDNLKRNYIGCPYKDRFCVLKNVVLIGYYLNLFQKVVLVTHIQVFGHLILSLAIEYENSRWNSNGQKWWSLYGWSLYGLRAL